MEISKPCLYLLVRIQLCLCKNGTTHTFYFKQEINIETVFSAWYECSQNHPLYIPCENLWTSQMSFVTRQEEVKCLRDVGLGWSVGMNVIGLEESGKVHDPYGVRVNCDGPCHGWWSSIFTVVWMATSLSTEIEAFLWIEVKYKLTSLSFTAINLIKDVAIPSLGVTGLL